jgi:hypothetical protein
LAIANDWTILHADGGIALFDLSDISLETSAFKNNLGAGRFSLQSTSTDLLVHFSSVPEPTATLALIAAALIATRRSSRANSDRITV